MPEAVEIREAVPSDFRKLLPLFQKLQSGKKLDRKRAKAFFEEMVSSDRHFAWVAVSDGKIVGYMDVVFRTYHFAFDFVARIETTIVDERMRRLGIASQLIKKCEEKARGVGCKVIELDSGMQRRGAHKFYEKSGYVERGYLFWKKLG